MPTVGVVLNDDKPQALEVAGQMAQWLSQRNVPMGIPLTRVTELVHSPSPELRDRLAQLDLIVVLGGDGTLINTARLVAPFGIPVVGVNLGRLGFLTEVEVSELFPALERIVAGDYRIEERMMLEARLVRNGVLQPPYYALNDVVVTKGDHPRMIRVEAAIGEEVVWTYSADGLIVSSPTGSTAYSLSAGGPIVSPELHALLLTPICPHALDAKPLVIPQSQTVRLSVISSHSHAVVTVDGQPGQPMVCGDSVLIQKAAVACRLIRLGERTFFRILREKMQQGR
ncbi:NAD(+) kinase [Heliobacterium gestii]|uniref:NAD kinase n=1 Tax=Heliomicrobium gestii TaxID=2699 RepID=A0A845LAJ9_HELGE|nr:NAD(+)/NADH kinase [Heliomicrobium gestii]MBM7867950.1 NAD+ kinase [Heliomicrobium gestii]MZP43238.1 NAD(+) kinase [Heliomicrobium gestii]